VIPVQRRSTGRNPLVDDLFQNIQGQAAILQHSPVEGNDVELIV